METISTSEALAFLHQDDGPDAEFFDKDAVSSIPNNKYQQGTTVAAHLEYPVRPEEAFTLADEIGEDLDSRWEHLKRI